MFQTTCCLILLSLTLSFAPKAQVAKLDSLKTVLEATEDYKAKAALYAQIGDLLKSNNPDLALPYFQKMLSIAKGNHDQQLLSQAFTNLGVFYYGQNDLEKSMEYYYKALDGLSDEPKNYEILGRIHNNIGWNFQKQKDYIRALNYYETSKFYTEKSGDQGNLGMVLNNIGVVYKNQGRNNEALGLFKEALQVNRKAKNTRATLFNVNNIGLIYMNTQHYPLAIEYFAEALTINYELQEFGEAANNLHNLGVALFKSKQFKPAQDTLTRALEISNRLQLADLKHQILNDLYKITLDQKEYKKALKYFTEYKAMDDSLYRKGQYTSLVELEAKYKVSQSERTIQLSQSQLLNQQLVNAVILGILLVAIVLIVFLVWIYGIKKKNEKTLIALNKEIDAKNAKIQAINQNLELTIEQRTKTIQEQNIRLKGFAFLNSHKVRRPLSSILGLVNLLKEEKNSVKIQELIDMIDGSAKEMDDIIFEINQNLQEEKL